jgi:hypothetical protein
MNISISRYHPAVLFSGNISLSGSFTHPWKGLFSSSNATSIFYFPRGLFARTVFRSPFACVYLTFFFFFPLYSPCVFFSISSYFLIFSYIFPSAWLWLILSHLLCLLINFPFWLFSPPLVSNRSLFHTQKNANAEISLFLWASH